MGIDPVTHRPRLDLLDLSSILSSTLYGSTQMNIQRLLGTNTVVNPELLKLASSPFPSLQQRQHQNMCAQNCEENHLCDPQIQNQIPQDLAQEALPFNHTQFVESNMNIIPYPSIFQDSSFQQHSSSHVVVGGSIYLRSNNPDVKHRCSPTLLINADINCNQYLDGK